MTDVNDSAEGREVPAQATTGQAGASSASSATAATRQATTHEGASVVTDATPSGAYDPEPVATAARRPLQSLRRRWLPAAVLTLVTTVAGAGVGLAMPVTYTAEARVAVGAGDMSIGAIAGFPTAATDLASNYARYINDKGLQNQDTQSVTMSASPIPDSSIIRIEGTGTDKAAVISATQKTADDLVSVANKTDTDADPAVTLTKYKAATETWAKSSAALTTAQTTLAKLKANSKSSASAIAAATTAVTNANAKATQDQQVMTALGAKYQSQIVDTSSAADLLVVRKADVSATDRTSKIERYGLMGFVVGAALSLLMAVWLDRRRRDASN